MLYECLQESCAEQEALQELETGLEEFHWILDVQFQVEDMF